MRLPIPRQLSIRRNGPNAAIFGGCIGAAIGGALGVVKFLQVGESVAITSYPFFGLLLGMIATAMLSLVTGNIANPFSRRGLDRMSNAPVSHQRWAAAALSFPFTLVGGGFYMWRFQVRDAHSVAIAVLVTTAVLAIGLPAVIGAVRNGSLPRTKSRRYADGELTPELLIADAERRAAMRAAAGERDQTAESASVAVADKSYSLDNDETQRLLDLTDRDAATANTQDEHLDHEGALRVPDLECKLVTPPRE
jgi:hypothetical protein